MKTFWLHHERTRGLRSAFLLTFACALVLHSATAVRPAAAQPTIGLYSDAGGSSCSLSGNTPGLLTTYVVVRPDEYGVRAVQFAAEIPPCLGATFVADVVPAGMLVIGSSPTGINVALQSCSFGPVNVLQIMYMRSGDTTPCCEFSLVADPAEGKFVAVSCAYQESPLTSVVSYFNADASCACIGNSAPHAPVQPAPYDNQSAVSVHTSFSWNASDSDGNLAEYDVYLGTTSSPPLVASELTEKAYTPAAPLAPLTQHYWRVVARDALDLETSSATWTFTTRAVNSPPYAPFNPSPTNATQGVSLEVSMNWLGFDVDGDPLTYDMYFGTATPPPLIAEDLVAGHYSPGTLAFSTAYYWRVVSRDSTGQETSGPIWWFGTRPENYPPNLPVAVAPVNDAQGVSVTPTLSWAVSDIDPDTLVSDLYFGTSPTPPLVASDLATTVYVPPGLTFSTQYFWKIVVRDQHGAERVGPTWNFRTRPENYPPTAPYNPSPANGTANRSETTTLTWQCSDLDGHAITYDVYFGTAASPPLVATDVATNSYVPGLLAFGTTYRWRIVARDVLGAETSGALWTFTTQLNRPPNEPFSPSPGNLAVNQSVNSTLVWRCTDPDGHTLTFDVYFGTSSPPPLVATNVPVKSYAPGPLAFTTTYRWQIVARDAFGLERSGPAWSFTTKANSAPPAPSNPSPPHHGVAGEAPVLTWNCTDVDGQALTFDVYFGTTSPPPLVASALTTRSFDPGTLPFAQYFWRVVASDGLLSTSGATWDFRVAEIGDANLDGAITLADASCAIGAYVLSGPCMMGGPLADVDCNGTVTPRDARCIHKHVVDGSCTFCGGSAVTAPADVNTPMLSVSSTWEWNDTLYVRLLVSGVPSLEAFGFIVDSNASQMTAVRRGATNGFVELRSSSYGVVGGYSLSGASASSPVEFIDLRFYASYWYDRYAVIAGFVDDLAGANPLSLYLGGGGVPVLITRFDAAAVEAGVEVRWELQSDEAVASFTLYRREEGAALPVEIAQGPAGAASQSFLDTSVEGGTTYHYELLIRTTGGGEFRSQVATVSTSALTLTLGQNHPNPFNPQTVIPYDMPHSNQRERVRLWILDISGRVVTTLVDEEQSGGSHRVTWQGQDDRGEAVSSGVYFYVLDVGGERRTKKLVLLK
jgi:hypothetical protein